MDSLDDELDRLDEILAGGSHEALTAVELEGFFAGLVVCPELISPSKWLHYIWSEDGEDVAVPVADLSGYQEFLALVMKRYNAVALSLMEPDAYDPVFAFDTDGTALWELWISGFERAMRISPDGWDVINNGADEEAIAALSGICALALLEGNDLDMPESNKRRLRADAPKLIALSVKALNNFRLRGTGSPQPRASRAKPPAANPGKRLGRNDPCFCGSGRKYKKCHGAN